MQVGNDHGTNSVAQCHQICYCEEAAGRRGALSAKREEVPLGCNLGQALTISPMTFLLSNLVLRDSHVASLLGMTIGGAFSVGDGAYQLAAAKGAR